MQLLSYRHTEAGIHRARQQREQVGIISREAAQAAKKKADEEARMRAEREREARLETALMFARVAPNQYRFQRIEAMAVRIFKISLTELRSDRRYDQAVNARQFVMYWAVRLTGFSTPQIGRKIGGRDHTTVLHGVAKWPVKRAKMGRTLRVIR